MPLGLSKYIADMLQMIQPYLHTAKVSQDLNKIDHWCNLNNMTINVTNSKVMFVTSKSTYFIPYKIMFVCWNRKLFYNAYILPHFDYCCIIWGNCDTALDDKLVIFKKRATRLILNLDCLTHSAILFNTLKWMTFPEWVVYQNALQMYKTIHRDAPDYLTTPFTFTSDIHSRLPQHIICTHPDQDMKYSDIHLHFQGLLSGILSLLTSKTHQMSNSSKFYIWVGSEILPHTMLLCNATQITK